MPFLMVLVWPVLPWLSLTPVTPHILKSKPVLGPKRPNTGPLNSFQKIFKAPTRRQIKKKLSKRYKYMENNIEKGLFEVYSPT